MSLSLRQRVAKRTFDLVVSIPLLMLSGWLILLLWLVSTADTGKNGIFTQTRVGQHGRTFRIMKIRTMRDMKDFDTTVTSDSDPRITRLGAFLRRTKLDELPQLINIVRGDMSFVGPRPDVPGFADELTGSARKILTVRPGVTGPATLRFRDESTVLDNVADPEDYNRKHIFPEKVRLNVDYVENYRFATDLRILWQTIAGSR